MSDKLKLIKDWIMEELIKESETRKELFEDRALSTHAGSACLASIDTLDRLVEFINGLE